ncbi:HAMP domain-containing sensor histidine kinase [Kocuria sp. TGY1127_2]|uniref:sensor histidine kinase n=1 Tax=Kocuria sp. TGY1127_2 TaxID=2711328 RepID=UPI0015B8467B|nr:HAMP domain-containing sensor histidine kinase [Kocuria sp. TGY1127_2]
MTGSHASSGPRRSPAFNPGSWRLRTRLIVILMLLLGLACLVIGLVSYGAMNATLTGQLDSQLSEASSRATNFSGAGPDQADGAQQAAPNPLNAPGQAAGTLNARIDDGQFVAGGFLDTGGSAVKLTESDRQTLKNIRPGNASQKVDLSQGDYLVVSELDHSGQVVLTGLPLKGVHRTLSTLVAIMLGVSVAALLLAGLLGSIAVRRTMKPLERVSSVATSVSRLDLESGQLPAASRVAAPDAHQDTEVGAVGHALNRMLDNVGSALTARQKSEDKMRAFIADASHELRTPLAAIRGYSDLLKWTEDFTPEGEKSLGRIDSQSQRMAGLVEDLLLLARLDEGREPERESVDLTELVIENVSDLQVAAPDHEWELKLPEDPVVVQGDPRQLQRVLLNLLSNARKHTDPGTWVATRLGTSADRQEAVLAVTDNGPGIEPEFQEKIFARFARADQARSGEVGTTGLGLAIVKAIVEAHNGGISLTSRPGHTEFEVRLPLLAATE